MVAKTPEEQIAELLGGSDVIKLDPEARRQLVAELGAAARRAEDDAVESGVPPLPPRSDLATYTTNQHTEWLADMQAARDTMEPHAKDRFAEEREIVARGQPVSGNLADLTDVSEARTETSFARLEGKLDTLSISLEQCIGTLTTSIAQQRAEALSNKAAIITTVVAVGFALATLLLAVMTYGDAIFSRGMSARDVVKAVRDEQRAAAPATALPATRSSIAPANSAK